MVENGISADYGPAGGLRLCDQHAIEWILVVQGQQASPDGVLGIDRQFVEALVLRASRAI